MTADIKILILLIVLLLSVMPTAFSKTINNLGNIGRPYPILEQDMLDMIYRRLKKKGEINKLNKRLKDEITKSIMNPKGRSLPRAIRYRGQEIVSIHTVKKAIEDGKGKVLYRAGTQVNALNIMSLTKILCFFDGNDKKQVDWILETCGKNPSNKLILVQGKYIDLMKKLKRKVYFDQRGVLIDKLKIKALPATFRQYGKKLYVEEHYIN